MEDNKRNEEQYGIEQIYNCIGNYILYHSPKPKEKLDDLEKEGLSSDEISSREKDIEAFLRDYDKNKKQTDDLYDELCENVKNHGITYLDNYVAAIEKLYKEQKDLKKEIKGLLIDERILGVFKKLRNDMTELFPILKRINEAMPVDDYVELSLSPRASLYGSEIKKTKKGSTKRYPSSNEDIKKMLRIFRENNDYKHLGEWTIAILSYTKESMIEGVPEKFLKEREDLKKWSYEQIEFEEDYKSAVMNVLFKDRALEKILDACSQQGILLETKKTLTQQVEKLGEEQKEAQKDYEERAKKQYEMIQERNATIESLKQKVKEYDRCKEQLTFYMEKCQEMEAEAICAADENEKHIIEVEKEYDSLCEKYEDIQKKYDDLKMQYSALQADYSLKNNELSKNKEMDVKKEKNAQTEMLRVLINGIGEQLFYLDMFLLELKETGKLDSENVELYGDTLNNINEVFDGIGIHRIGILDETVKYDSSIHISEDGGIANGDPVVIKGPGWKIGEDVYIKASVEKED